MMRVLDELEKISNQRYLPNIFIRGEHFSGGDRDIFRAHRNGQLARLLAKHGIPHSFKNEPTTSDEFRSALGEGELGGKPHCAQEERNAYFSVYRGSGMLKE